MHHFNYTKELNSIQWKELRIEIIKRDNKCQCCGSTKNLEVHHIFYFINTVPYDYHQNMLITLCRECHKKETNYSQLLDNFIKYMKYKGLLSHEIIELFFENLIDSDFIEFHGDMKRIKERKKH